MMFSKPEISGSMPTPRSKTRGDTALHHGRPAGRLVDAGEQAQQGGLAGTVAADQPDAVALLEVQVDVLECLDDDGVVGVASDGAARRTEEGLLQGERDFASKMGKSTQAL